MECRDYWKQTGPKWGAWLWQEFYANTGLCETAFIDRSFTISCFFPPLHPLYEMNVCSHTHSTLYRCLEIFGTKPEMTFWHSLNGKCMLTIENERCGLRLFPLTNHCKSEFPRFLLIYDLYWSCGTIPMYTFMSLPTTALNRVICSERNKRQPHPVMITLDIRCFIRLMTNPHYSRRPDWRCCRDQLKHSIMY